MSVTILEGATTSTTGGSALVFSRTNTPVNNGNEYADVSEPDFFAREKVIIATKQPQLQPDGTYSKQKTSARYIAPLVLADGSTVYNVTRVETEIHPETPAANLAKHREYGAQLAIQAGLDPSYTAGTLPE